MNRELTEIHIELNSVLKNIKEAAMRGEHHIGTYINDTTREELKKLGYDCRPETDCDSNYCGDGINW